MSLIYKYTVLSAMLQHNIQWSMPFRLYELHICIMKAHLAELLLLLTYIVNIIKKKFIFGILSLFKNFWTNSNNYYIPGITHTIITKLFFYYCLLLLLTKLCFFFFCVCFIYKIKLVTARDNQFCFLKERENFLNYGKGFSFFSSKNL